MARYMTFFVLQLKDCVGFGGIIGNLCLRVVLSAKHLVRSIGHMAHALQHFLIGFLNFCNVSLNMLYGYSIGIGSWFCSGSVSCMVTISLLSGLNLAFTSFFLRDELALYVIIREGSLGICFSECYYVGLVSSVFLVFVLVLSCRHRIG